MKQSPNIDRLLSLSIAFLTLGCEPSEFRPVPAFPNGSGSSGGYSAPARPSRPMKPQPTSKPLVPDRHPMLDDPEAQTEDRDEDIFANSLADAQEKCRKRAEWLSLNGGGVTQYLGVKHIKGKLYRCQLRSEVEN
ncbi:hypothetical protein LEP3755_07410 [Leptolyngbya sp. NIES-3755]|nr:hypothetical protein LEP3755_07410 [Leptolyngbya sp. NIES-3755]